MDDRDCELTCTSTVARFTEVDCFTQWEPSVTALEEFPNNRRRVVFVKNEFYDLLENIDNDPQRLPRYVKAERRGEPSSRDRVERFLDCFAAAASQIYLADYEIGQRPPLKRLTRDAHLRKGAIWEVRLQQYRMFGWWICENVFVVFSGHWTDPVHEAKGRDWPSPEWHGDRIIRWREDNGLTAYIWWGGDDDVQ